MCSDDDECNFKVVVAKIIPLALFIPMLVLAFQWRSEILSEIGHTDPCNVLTTVEVDNFRFSVAGKIQVPLIVAGFMVLMTVFCVCNSCAKYVKVSLGVLIVIIIIEAGLFIAMAVGISNSAEYYKSAIKNEQNPTTYYKWNDREDSCTVAMDKLQSQAKCCGYRSLHEWDWTRPSGWNSQIFPPSCCSDFEDWPPTDRQWCVRKRSTFSENPCNKQLKSWIFKQWAAKVFWIALAVWLFQICCGLWVYVSIRRQQKAAEAERKRRQQRRRAQQQQRRPGPETQQHPPYKTF